MLVETPAVHYWELIETNRDSFAQPLFHADRPPSMPDFYFHEGKLFIRAGLKKELRGKKYLLLHKILYQGTGREGAQFRYLTFKEEPKEFSLQGWDSAKDPLLLSLDDSIGKTFAIRILPANPIPPTALPVYKSKTVQIRQELFAPLPKGEMQAADIRVTRVDYGSILFSTELRLKKYGKVEVVFEDF